MMRERFVLLVVFVALGMIGAAGCKKADAVTAPTGPPPLNAVPSSVSLLVGGSQSVAVSGGTPPYAIVSAPSASATATLQNADSLVATVLITGVSVASPPTSVTIKDNTPAPAKEVAISIKVQ